MPELNLAGDRYKYPVSNEELTRRLKAVQTAMKAAGLECVIAQTQNIIFDSVIRYMTDMPCHPYTTTIMIPSEGLITMINHGFDNDAAVIGKNLRNVGKLVIKPYCEPFECTNSLAGLALSKEINAAGYKKIGVLYKQLMNADLLDTVRENVKDCMIVDFSKEFSSIKAVKSPEEKELIKKCVRAHEDLIDMVPALIRPGRMEYEIIAEISKAAIGMGCEMLGNIAVGSSPNGTGSNFFQNFTANRRIEKGDAVTVMIEVSGPGGIYGELARTFCLGDPDPCFANLYELAKQAQALVAENAKPGISGKELNAVYDRFAKENNLDINKRFVGHSQGYDMMEAPAISPYEDMVLKEDMFFAIHPELMRDGQFTIACDNYLVTADGGQRVTTTPRELVIVEY